MKQSKFDRVSSGLRKLGIDSSLFEAIDAVMMSIMEGDEQDTAEALSNEEDYSDSEDTETDANPEFPMSGNNVELLYNAVRDGQKDEYLSMYADGMSLEDYADACAIDDKEDIDISFKNPDDIKERKAAIDTMVEEIKKWSETSIKKNEEKKKKALEKINGMFGIKINDDKSKVAKSGIEKELDDLTKENWDGENPFYVRVIYKHPTKRESKEGQFYKKEFEYFLNDKDNVKNIKSFEKIYLKDEIERLKNDLDRLENKEERDERYYYLLVNGVDKVYSANELDRLEKRGGIHRIDVKYYDNSDYKKLKHKYINHEQRDGKKHKPEEHGNPEAYGKQKTIAEERNSSADDIIKRARELGVTVFGYLNTLLATDNKKLNNEKDDIQVEYDILPSKEKEDRKNEFDEKLNRIAKRKQELYNMYGEIRSKILYASINKDAGDNIHRIHELPVDDLFEIARDNGISVYEYIWKNVEADDEKNIKPIKNEIKEIKEKIKSAEDEEKRSELEEKLDELIGKFRQAIKEPREMLRDIMSKVNKSIDREEFMKDTSSYDKMIYSYINPTKNTSPRMSDTDIKPSADEIRGKRIQDFVNRVNTIDPETLKARRERIKARIQSLQNS